MKKIIFSIQIISLLLLLNRVCNGQSITVNPNDTVNLELPVFTGTVQWQESVDSLTWSDITGATYQPYQIIALTSKYYRARINSGMCNPVYSGGRHVIVTVFICGTNTISDIDGNIYNTVSIGAQCWMKQNLNYGTYVTAATGQGAAGVQKYCYGDNLSNCNSYGGLYTWNEAMNGAAGCNGLGSGMAACTNPVQGICPIGWHIPSHYEFTVLEGNVGSNPSAFPYDETTSGTFLGSNEGTNLKAGGTSGFEALLAGLWDPNAVGFFNNGTNTNFWTSTDNGANAWTRTLNVAQGGVKRGTYDKLTGFSVRCVKNDSPTGSLPTISTDSITNITQTTATGHSNVTGDGGATVTARGVCWNTTSNPTVTNSHTVDGTGTGIFTSSITGLLEGTTYYIRAYATNSMGTAYGNEMSFIPSIPNCGIVTDIDGNIYNTVSIGTQCWMRENLKTAKYRDGTAIPNVIDNATWAALTTGARSYYNNDSTTNTPVYGVLYNWYAATDAHNLCPTGWHVPIDAEWTQLTDYLGGESVAGGKMKETGTTHWTSPNTGADNSSGFTALPGGYRSYDGTFANIDNYGNWWSSTEFNTASALLRYLLYNSASVTGSSTTYSKRYGCSVRCLQD